VIVKYDQQQERVHFITANVEPCNVIVYIPRSLQQLLFEYEKSAINSRERAQRRLAEEREVGAHQLDVQREGTVDEVYDQLVFWLPTTRQTTDHHHLLASADVIARQGDRLLGP